MKKLLRTFWNYLTDKNTNIFKNYIDALFGMIVLVVLPGISLVTTLKVGTASWANYTFPIFTIVLSDIYDTIGRFESGKSNSVKLISRFVVDLISLFLAALFIGRGGIVIIIPPLLLLICGLTISVEAFLRVKVAICISEWYADNFVAKE